MGCGAILRRKLLSASAARFIGLLNLGNNQTTGAAFTTLTHKYPKLIPNNTSSQLSFIITPPNSLYVRHASTNTCTPEHASSNVGFNVLRRLCSPFLAVARTFNTVIHMTSNDWALKRGECNIVYYTIMVRYRLGIKLLRADANIAKRLLLKISDGKCLSRRERQLLTRATGDMFRLIPGFMFIVVPSIQILLPLLLKLYPNVLPANFRDKITGQERVMRKLRARKEYAKFLRETAIEMAKVVQNSPSGIKPMAEEFRGFWIDMRVCRPVSNEDIFRFAKLFSDELTLDHLKRPLMEDMCKSMGITPFGSDEYLRFILREKLNSIKKDDKLIQSKGVELLSEAEVRKACTERGIHVAEEMEQQLCDWLDLSLNHDVPSSLLIISRGFTGTKKLKPEEAMKVTLSSLPYNLVYMVGMASLPCNDPRIDQRRKIEALKLQEELIKEEEEKKLSYMKHTDAIQDDVPPQEMTVSTPEQARARAADKDEKPYELFSDAITVLNSVLNVSTECDKLLGLVDKEINLYSSCQGRKGPEGEKEDIKEYRATQEENSKYAELDVGDNVLSALMNRANGMLQKLEKDTDGVDANISYRWRVLGRYCDGKVSLDMVAAAAFLKDTVDKEGIQELITNLSKYKEESVKLGVGAEDINGGQNELVSKSEEL